MHTPTRLAALALLATLGACAQPMSPTASAPAGMPMTTATTPADQSPVTSPGQANYDPASINASQARGGRR